MGSFIRSMYTKDNVSLGFWNIDGLYTRVEGQRLCKLDDDVFKTYIKNFDIIGLVETHLGSNDQMVIEGYKIYQNNRPKTGNATKYYGGIAVAVRNTIRKGVKILPPTNTEITWIKLCGKFFNLEQDLYIAIAYVSPYRSSFTCQRDNIFELLENDVNEYSKLGNCMICADFNAKTGCEPDFCSDDNIRYLDLPNDYVNDTSLNRNNMDLHKVDDHGKELLSLCKTSGLRILNGRTLGDILGYCTCYSPNGQPSTIDYILATTSALKNIDYFHVHPPTELSIHCMLSTKFKASFEPSDESRDLHPTPDKYKWGKLSDTAFQEALVRPEIQAKINAFLDKTNSDLTTDCAVDELNDILKTAAKMANIPQTKASRNKKKTKRRNRKWFDDDCRAMRWEMRKAASKLRQNPHDTALQHYYQTLRKKYKKLIKTTKSSFREKLLEQLETLSENNPQSFWSLYDKLIDLDKQQKSNPITPEEWVRHFTDLLLSTAVNQQQVDSTQYMQTYINENVNKVFNELNFHITLEEVSKAITKLKRGKSCGLDSIPNEMLKAGSTELLKPLHKLFNLIFMQQNFPASWRLNTLTPLHKKGDINSPGNYRGIALSGSVCKLFCHILHHRLVKYIEDKKLIPPNQIGYKKGARTSDHILTLKTLIDKYVNTVTKSKLFVCFVDFKSAFDTISRSALFFKLLKAEVGGNFLKTLISMYQEVYFHIKLPSGLTETILSNAGVKQGCVLSPTLFNFFISDMPEIFDATCDPVTLYDTKLSCLMFADDLALISTSASGLQNSLNKLADYCDKWGLHVNLSKTKVIIFNQSGRLLNKYQFSYIDQPIEIVRSYIYLGITFICCGSFTKAIERLTDQAMKALFKLKQKDVRNHVLTALKLFDTLILPILRYCSEIWSPFIVRKLNPDNIFQHSDKTPIEKVHLKFCRYLLGVHRKSVNAAVRAELGRRPLLLELLSHSAKYWLQLCKASPESFAKKAYAENLMLIYPTDISSQGRQNWASLLKNMLRNTSLQHVWDNQGSRHQHKIVKLFKKSMNNVYDTAWEKDLSRADAKLRTYKTFKPYPSLENYILACKNVNNRREFTKLRISAHQLRIERGRYTRPRVTPVEERLCNMCKNGEIEDEKHFVTVCSQFRRERELFYEKLNSFSSFEVLTNNEKFLFIMSYNNGDTEVSKHVLEFINTITTKREALGIAKPRQ